MSAFNNRTVETKVLSTLNVSSVLFELDNEIESDNESEDETDCYNCKNCDENHLVDKMYKIEDSDDEDNGMYLLCRLCFSESEDICKGCYKKCPEPIAIGCVCDDCEYAEESDSDNDEESEDDEEEKVVEPTIVYGKIVIFKRKKIVSIA